MSTELRQETYVPETAEQRQLASVQAFLETHGHTGAADGRSAYLLSGAGRDEQVELPEEVSAWPGRCRWRSARKEVARRRRHHTGRM